MELQGRAELHSDCTELRPAGGGGIWELWLCWLPWQLQEDVLLSSWVAPDLVVLFFHIKIPPLLIPLFYCNDPAKKKTPTVCSFLCCICGCF